MPRELITICVGQCGNQIGSKFWDFALREHALHARDGRFDDAMSSFFRNVDASGDMMPVGSAIRSLRARAVLVDMEEGVLRSVLRSGLGELFDQSLTVASTSGSGNNWAQGHCSYGPQYGAAIRECVRRCAETCDSLQSFLMVHSLGGGTGSGLGTYTLGLLRDEFPDVFRFAVSIFPSEEDHVITSPYNRHVRPVPLRTR